MKSRPPLLTSPGVSPSKKQKILLWLRMRDRRRRAHPLTPAGGVHQQVLPHRHPPEVSRAAQPLPVVPQVG